MALFPTAERRVYGYTFLLNTSSILHFDERNEENCGSDVKERFKDFLTDNFNTTGQHNYPTEGLQVDSDDRVVSYEFGQSYAAVRVGRPQYTTFGKSMLPHVSRLRRFVDKVLNLKMVKSIGVRKISVLPIQLEEQTPDAEMARNMMSKVLSTDVMSLMTIRELEDVDNTIGPMTMHVMEDPDTNFRYEILRGVLKDQKRQNIYNVVLDARCYFMPSGGVETSEVEDKLSDMSRSLYDLYHWAVQNHVIEAMKGGMSNG